MTPIKAVIISEEKETFQILKKFEEENAMIMEIIGNADSINDGVVIIKEKKPDAIFLDVVLENNLFFEILTTWRRLTI